MKYEIFTNPETNEYEGFAGQVQVFDIVVFMNTKTGEGFDLALKKMERMVHALRKKYYSNMWFSVDDALQDIKLKMLESLTKFDPRKEVRLNTYLQMVLECKLKNQIRDENSVGNNATTLKVSLLKYSCKCGNVFERIENSESKKAVCSNCQLSENLKQIKIAHKEIKMGEWFEKENKIVASSYNPEEVWMLKHDFENFIAKNDIKTNEFLEMLIIKGMTFSDIAKKWKTSTQTVLNFMKEIKNDIKIKELYL